MSTTSLIRGALKKAAGPSTATEIAESLGLEVAPVRNLLYAMVKTGEVDQDSNDDGKATFVLDPKFKPTRRRPGDAPAAAEEAASTPRKPRAAKAARKAKAEKPRKAKRAKVDRAPRASPARKAKRKVRAAVEAPTTSTPANGHDRTPVAIERWALRSLLAHLFASHQPLDSETRAAAAHIVQEAA